MGDEEKEVLALISAKASKELKDEFQRVCKERDVNPSAVVRHLVRGFINGTIEIKV